MQIKRAFSLLETLIASAIFTARERSSRKVKTPGFSLLETLIASAILITITSSVVALSNSTVTGTIVNADETVINRWGAEALEAITKIRDDRVSNNQLYWLAQADNADKYGWYELEPDGNFWKIATNNPVGPNSLERQLFPNYTEALSSGSLNAYRLICIEAVGAESPAEDSTNPDAKIRCNTESNGSTPVSDGDRNSPSSCNDRYCTMTKPSLNANNLDQNKNIIPAGNAVKVRVVIVWQDKEKYRAANFVTIFTNWRNTIQ